MQLASLQCLGRLACTLLLVPTGHAAGQQGSAASPHVPQQILTATRVFVSNAGGDTYGAAGYVDLTQYGGGPNRFYNQYYEALKSWGRYELVDRPADADIVIQVRFSEPAIDRAGVVDLVSDPDPNIGYVAQPRESVVRDPQLVATVLDPATHVILWTLVEHIEPGHGSAVNDAHFDQAVARIVGDTRTLADGHAELLARPAPPPGAFRIARQHERMRHAALGALFGLAASSVLEMTSAVGGCQSVACHAGYADFRNTLYIDVGGTVAGALAGWFWPTRY